MAITDSTGNSPQPAQPVVSNKIIRQLSRIRLEEVNECKKLAKMPLLEAGEVWLEERGPFIAPRTVIDYRIYISILAHFFGNVPLEKLANPDLIKAYQCARGKYCAPSTVNHEIGVLQQMLKRIRRWQDVKPYYEALPPSIRGTPGRALTPEEESRLLEAGRLRPGWAVVYNLTILALHTAAGPGELMGLRFRDVFIDDPETARIYIQENAKNKHRVREVPLNADGIQAVRALMALARSNGSGLPDHYLIPFRESRGQFDPTRHAPDWPDTAWREMCAAANVRLRPYDLRHSGLTKLAEKNPEQVVLKIAGHVSPQMLRRIYAHVRLPALRAAVNSISSASNTRPERDGNPANVETTDQTLLRAANMADKLGISLDKAVEFLVNYEREQAVTSRKET